jgi:hypothetical protein
MLDSCYSAEQAERLAKTIDCVVGTEANTNERDAHSFAAALYTGLAAGMDVQSAYELARARLALAGGDADSADLVTRSGIDPQESVLVKTQSEAAAIAQGSPSMSVSQAAAARWTSRQREMLCDAILDVFTHQELRRFVRVVMEEDLNVIVPTSSLQSAVYYLVDYAERTGRLAELLVALVHERPHMAVFRELQRTAGLSHPDSSGRHA